MPSAITSRPHRHPVLQADHLIPRDLRGQLILLRFAKPIPRAFCEWFYALRLTPDMLQKGEERFRAVAKFQSDRLVKNCPACGKRMVRLTETVSRCISPGCLTIDGDGQERESRGVRVYSGPVRGVVRVIVGPEHVSGRDERGELIRGCALALDRRYDDAVRIALWYAAGHVTEIVRAETGVDARLK